MNDTIQEMQQEETQKEVYKDYEYLENNINIPDNNYAESDKMTYRDFTLDSTIIKN